MKKLIIRIILFVVIIGGIQRVIYGLKLQSDFPELALLQKHLNEKVDLIYFGDSSIGASARSDEDKRPLNVLLDEQMDDIRVEGIHHPAYHMDLYLSFCEKIINSSSHPKYVLIPINLRSFSSEWNQRPEYQFVKEKNYLADEWYAPFYNGIRVFDKEKVVLSFHEFMNLPVHNGDSLIGTIKDFTGPEYETITEENTRKKIQFHYFNKIDEQHQKVQCLIALCELFKNEDIALLFYITPIDIETGTTYFPNFNSRINENIAVLSGITDKYNCQLIDASKLLSTNEFSWKQDKYPNEHMNSKGKLKLATFLSDYILELNP